MSVFFNLRNGVRAEIVMPNGQGERLSGTCFRGKDCHQAGNFFAWNCFREFLQDQEVRALLTQKFEALIAKGSVHVRHRIELELIRAVGWDSAVHVSELDAHELRACTFRSINKRSGAMFLPDGIIHAPRTPFVTMVLSMRHQGHWKFIIGTIYPGEDCGELRGDDLTAEHGLVFMGWSNPGE